MKHTLRAECTKALTLRSVRVTLLAALVVQPSIALAAGLAYDPGSAVSALTPIESHGFQTAGFGQALIIVLAAIVAGSENRDGQLRTTVLAEPRRGRVLAAKLVVVALLAMVLGVVATSAAVVVEQATLGDDGLRPHEFTAGMGWNVVGVGVNYALIAVMTASVAVLTRSMVVPVVVLVPLVLGLTLSMLGMFPLLRYSPDLAGIQMLTGYPGIGLLEPGDGALVMVAWAAVLGLAAWFGLRRRDVGGTGGS